MFFFFLRYMFNLLTSKNLSDVDFMKLQIEHSNMIKKYLSAPQGIEVYCPTGLLLNICPCPNTFKFFAAMLLWLLIFSFFFEINFLSISPIKS